jgi:Glyoxalase-like domain
VAARLRQAVLASTDLEGISACLSQALGLGAPYADPAVGAFGLQNAVFALGDTFLEVVSPVREDTAAGRRLERRGGDCGYMVMFEIDDLDRARRLVAGQSIREVFAIELDDIAEVHLHPADIGGAIVALSRPQPPGSWRWGGPDWPRRSSPHQVSGVTVSAADPTAVAARWSAVLGVDPSELRIRFTDQEGDAGIVAVELTGPRDAMVELDRVRVTCTAQG